MQTPFRMYVNESCPVCAEAKRFMQERGLPVEVIVAGFDQVINSGLSMILKSPVPTVPFLISFATQQMLAGFVRENYEQVVRDYSVLVGAVAPRPNTSGGDNTQPPANLVKSVPDNGGVDPVFNVPGVLGSNGARARTPHDVARDRFNGRDHNAVAKEMAALRGMPDEAS